jgi:REP element-mobilizing transposase RayT
MGEIIKKTIERMRINNFTLTEIECEKDHIHLLVSYLSKQPVTNVVTKLKQYLTFSYLA